MHDVEDWLVWTTQISDRLGNTVQVNCECRRWDGENLHTRVIQVGPFDDVAAVIAEAQREAAAYGSALYPEQPSLFP